MMQDILSLLAVAAFSAAAILVAAGLSTAPPV